MAIKELGAVLRMREEANRAEINRLKKRIADINDSIHKIAHKTDDTSKKQRAKLTEDLRISREQKKKLMEKEKASSTAAVTSPHKGEADKKLVYLDLEADAEEIVERDLNGGKTSVTPSKLAEYIENQNRYLTNSPSIKGVMTRAEYNILVLKRVKQLLKKG